MKIVGLNKTTLLDYPEHVAAVLFTGGCNFRCPFCHNAPLVLYPERQAPVPEEAVFDLLRKRRGILEGVCVTGGEPTLQEDLGSFLEKIKELGYLVKLDTNGYQPEVLRGLMERRLLDYVAMDVKSSLRHYERAAGVRSLEKPRLEESAEILRGCGLPYEFRTTAVKGIHSAADFEEIGAWLRGSRAYFLQTYRENENVIGEGGAAFPREELENFAAIMRRHIQNVRIRG
ncbi:MAG: anaerobic ribonucleoside-triphosphate reductase activating protein [Clostridium sp.]|jgi:pyruvate formate lyase activating enzyme|nr:anaerobic ribonucleoside-triphosphate reductase activating protein [Clostridium sp.]